MKHDQEFGDSCGQAITGIDSYVIDAESSRFRVRAFATGLLAMGHDPAIAIRGLSRER